MVHKRWTAPNLGAMRPDEKQRLARTGDTGILACAIRLRAARMVTGLNQTDFARTVGIGLSALNNSELALNFPSREAMRYLTDQHRIDYNFILGGLWNHLAGDVQDQLFPALAAANSEWDRKEGAGRSRVSARQRPARS